MFYFPEAEKEKENRMGYQAMEEKSQLKEEQQPEFNIFGTALNEL